MLQTWRWFGPDDPVSLENVASGRRGRRRQRAASYEPRRGLERRRGVKAPGRNRSGGARLAGGREHRRRRGDQDAQRRLPRRIDNYKQSIRNAARAGVKTFCYNFMAITDWTRTNLNWPLANGGTALRFDAVDCAAYDLFILERDGAEADYSPERIAAARKRFEAMTPGEIDGLERTLIDWLPARDFAYDRQSFRRALAALQRRRGRRPARQPLRVRARDRRRSPRRKARGSPSIPTIRPSRSSACRG